VLWYDYQFHLVDRDTGSPGARTSARASGAERSEIYGWKLFHREERPALERNTIDTSEWTCEDHRYAIGQHFGFRGNTSEPGELANIS
jgi:hypothetical protein